MKKSSDSIGNRTRDLPVCSAVPHTTTTTITNKKKKKKKKKRKRRGHEGPERE
jgi:hypothetical protein